MVDPFRWTPDGRALVALLVSDDETQAAPVVALDADVRRLSDPARLRAYLREQERLQRHRLASSGHPATAPLRAWPET